MEFTSSICLLSRFHWPSALLGIVRFRYDPLLGASISQGLGASCGRSVVPAPGGRGLILPHRSLTPPPHPHACEQDFLKHLILLQSEFVSHFFKRIQLCSPVYIFWILKKAVTHLKEMARESTSFSIRWFPMSCPCSSWLRLETGAWSSTWARVSRHRQLPREQGGGASHGWDWNPGTPRRDAGVLSGIFAVPPRSCPDIWIPFVNYVTSKCLKD